MTDDVLARELAQLGVDAESYRALALLPLVQVAWADGAIQDAERTLILTLADQRYALGDEGKRVLKNWLHHPPTADFARRGRSALLSLCGRDGYDKVSRADLVDVITLAKQVARSAGGFFGFGAISASEAETIDEIARALGIVHDRRWEESPESDDKPIRRWAMPEDDTVVPEDADRENDGPDVEILLRCEAPSTPGDPLLVHYDADRGDRAVSIDSDGVSIGRATSCDVQIKYDMQVSRQHCRIFARAENGEPRIYVEDLASVTGTWVNGERVVERRLFGGDQLVVGSTSFFVQHR